MDEKDFTETPMAAISIGDLVWFNCESHLVISTPIRRNYGIWTFHAIPHPQPHELLSWYHNYDFILAHIMKSYDFSSGI